MVKYQRRSANLMHPCVREWLKEQAAEKGQRAIDIDSEKVTRTVVKKRRQDEKS